MKYITLTFNNIGKFIRFHPVLFIFLIFAQVVCCIAVFISCGMAYNMEYVEKPGVEAQYFAYIFQPDIGVTITMKTDDNGNLLEFHYHDPADKGLCIDENIITSIDHPDSIPFPEFKEKFPVIMSQSWNKKSAKMQIMMYAGKTVDLVKYPTWYYYTIYPDTQHYKTDIPEEYITTSDPVILAPTNYGEKHNPYCFFYQGEKYDFYGTEFTCVGFADVDFIPYNAVPDEFTVGGIWLYFDGTMAEDEINAFDEKVKEVFGGQIVDNRVPEPYDPIEIQYSRMLFVVSIIVIIIILLALSKFYKFILSDRKTTLSVLRLCGCTRTKAHIVYMLEIFLTMAVTTGLGYLLYKFVFHAPIAEMYPAFEEFYITPVYLAVMGAYFAAAMVIMAVTVIPTTKADIRR